jgi:hypothetical protein
MISRSLDFSRLQHLTNKRNTQSILDAAADRIEVLESAIQKGLDNLKQLDAMLKRMGA